MKVSLFIQECGSHSTYIHSMRKEHWITLSQHVTVLNGLSIKGIGGGTRDSGGACSQHNRRSSHNKHQCHRKAYRVCLADRNSLGRPLVAILPVMHWSMCTRMALVVQSTVRHLWILGTNPVALASKVISAGATVLGETGRKIHCFTLEGLGLDR